MGYSDQAFAVSVNTKELNSGCELSRTNKQNYLPIHPPPEKFGAHSHYLSVRTVTSLWNWNDSVMRMVGFSRLKLKAWKLNSATWRIIFVRCCEADPKIAHVQMYLTQRVREAAESTWTHFWPNIRPRRLGERNYSIIYLGTDYGVSRFLERNQTPIPFTFFP